MNLTIKKDAPNSGEFTLNKFFQFNVLGEKESDGLHQVDSFNALCFKFDKKELEGSLNCHFDIKHFESGSNTNTPELKFEDKADYFNDINIIRQFWGKESSLNDNREEFIQLVMDTFEIDRTKQNDVSEEITTIYSCLEENEILPLIVNEHKENITPFILIPFKCVPTRSNNVKLQAKNTLHTLKVLRPYIALGFWFQTSYKVKLKCQLNEDIFKTEVKFNFSVKSPDFKVYFQIGENVALKKNKVHIESDSSLDPLTAEIIRVYSQSEINYFKDWIELGIYKSALLRLENSNKVNSRLNQSVKSVKNELILEDMAVTKKKEINIFVLSLFVSALIAMGLDATRLSNELFTLHFPTFPIVSKEFIWLLVCLGLILKYLTLQKSHHIKKSYKNVISFFSLFAVIWISCCFFIDIEILIDCKRVEEKPGCFIDGQEAGSLIKVDSSWTQWLPIIDIILNVYLGIALLCSSYYSKCKREVNQKLASTFKFLFGVQ